MLHSFALLQLRLPSTQTWRVSWPTQHLHSSGVWQLLHRLSVRRWQVGLPQPAHLH